MSLISISCPILLFVCSAQAAANKRQAVVDAIKQDEKEINKYEKLLGLKKRKSKTISKGFVDCGLDCILVH